jgi:hypothetical protein
MLTLILAYAILVILVCAYWQIRYTLRNRKTRRLSHRMRELYLRGQWELRHGYELEAARWFGRLHGEQALAGRSRRVKKQKVNVFRKE